MKIQTKYFGEQEIEESELITFPAGLPGFDDERCFVLQHFGDTFSILQSCNHSAIAFVVTSPFFFFKHYSLDLPDAFVDQLAIKNPDDVAVWVIVTVQSPFARSTANLKAPIIINIHENRGKQYIADHSSYSMRELLITESSEKRA
ncbi:MAG: flagellar assembly protein FliW [Sporolactobacillus sp.]